MTTTAFPRSAGEARSQPSGPISPLELSPQAMRELVDLALDRIVAHEVYLGDQRSVDNEGAEALARSLSEAMPESAESPRALLDQLFDRIITKGLNTASPGFLGYIPGGGLFHAAVADLVADAVNRYVGVFQASPGPAQVEATVIRWFCDMVGYPADGGGFFTSGGSLANLSAVVTARTERLDEDLRRGTIYTSSETHHSVAKAARLAGLPLRNVRSIAVDHRFRIRRDALVEAVTRDRAQGLQPFLLVGNAGTTNTGAVDDLDALADVAKAEDLWLHVDAAYGGFFLLTARGQHRLRGIERADSITLDPHKGLFLPYGTGCLLARDKAALARAHRADAAYLPSRDEGGARVDFCDISPELSRPFRGLRVWLPLKMHGVGVFRDALDEKLDLAAWAAHRLAAMPGIEVVAPPQLSTLAFRVVRQDLGPEALDRLNREVLRRINGRGRVFLNGTVTRGFSVIRLCVLSHRSHQRHVEQALDEIVRAVESVAP